MTLLAVVAALPWSAGASSARRPPATLHAVLGSVSKSLPASTSTEATDQPTCPVSTYPRSPSDRTPYAIAFKADIVSGTVNSGYNEDTGKLKKGQIYTAWQLHITNIIGQACGLLELPSLRIDIEPSGVVIDGNQAQIYVVVVPFQPAEQIQDFNLKVHLLGALAPAITQVLKTGQIEAEATHVGAHAVLWTPPNAPTPLNCPATVHIPELTTGAAPAEIAPGRGPSPVWAMKGSPVTGPLIGATATLVSNDFKLGPFTPQTDPKCGGDSAFAALFDNIIGGIDAQGKQYNPPAYDRPEIFKYGAPPGESQATLSIRLTYVDLPAFDPIPLAARSGA